MTITTNYKIIKHLQKLQSKYKIYSNPSLEHLFSEITKSKVISEFNSHTFANKYHFRIGNSWSWVNIIEDGDVYTLKLSAKLAHKFQQKMKVKYFVEKSLKIKNRLNYSQDDLNSKINEKLSIYVINYCIKQIKDDIIKELEKGGWDG